MAFLGFARWRLCFQATTPIFSPRLLNESLAIRLCSPQSQAKGITMCPRIDEVRDERGSILWSTEECGGGWNEPKKPPAAPAATGQWAHRQIWEENRVLLHGGNNFIHVVTTCNRLLVSWWCENPSNFGGCAKETEIGGRASSRGVGSKTMLNTPKILATTEPKPVKRCCLQCGGKSLLKRRGGLTSCHITRLWATAISVF
jgi:hypothetical protein